MLIKTGCYHIKSSAGYRFVIEVLFSVTIIALLVMIAIGTWVPVLPTIAKVTHFAGEPFLTTRAEAHCYHAINGFWPSENEEMTDPLNKQLRDKPYNYFGSVTIYGGAVHLTFRKPADMAGEILSIRPAVPLGDLQGPVIWVAGNTGRSADWTVYGEDKTTISSLYISRYLH